MFRPSSCRQLLVQCSKLSKLSRNAVILAPNAHILITQQPRATFATTDVKVEKSTPKKKKYKKRGDKSKPQQSPDVAKEREIQEMQQKVRFYHDQGNYDEALTAANELLTTTQDHFGKDHPATASAYNNVGLMHKLLGNYKDSQRMYHQALRSYGYILGKDHASYAAALHNLGVLLKTQVTLDESLSAMERLTLTEEAIQHLEEALSVRKMELGPEHPHTVASQSLLGSTIASQLLALQSQQQNSGDDNDTTVDSSDWKPSKMTLQRWEMAEQHLRAALDVAIQNPRGNRLQKDDATLVHDAFMNITTLSAAAAAQNLAIILKTRATLNTPLDEIMLQEARDLYQQALKVRSSLLHEAHPDVVATKFSLAELLDVGGDKEQANTLRQEIMDSYNITEVDDEDESESTTASENENVTK